MGGKSRKSGGVSKKLVMALKNGTYSKSSKGSCGKKQDQKPYSQTLFEYADEDRDEDRD